MNDYPFLVHSQESLSQQSAPNVDNKRLARQKRRRTSPEDQAILEAEYDHNPKPDKATRMEIVKKVALGEKEVQIWFQNRRQVTRRRSRPLLPHEILANFRSTSQSSQHVASSNSLQDDRSQQWLPSSQNSVSVSQNQSLNTQNESSGSSSQEAGGVHEHQPSSQTNTSTPSTIERSLTVDAAPKRDSETQVSSLTDLGTEDLESKKDGDLLRSLSQAMFKRRKTDSLGRRRNASFIIHDEGHQMSQKTENSISKVVEQVAHSKSGIESSQALRRTSSLVRLSLSLEGKAQVTTKTGTTPSPPRKQHSFSTDVFRRPNPGLQRSFSAVEPMKRDNSINPSFSRSIAGRSHDSRTWEFYCDKEARGALTEQAEREESGSATAIIALIQSNSSSKKAVNMYSNKRNGRNHDSEAAKRFKSEGRNQRLKLSRSQSSLANMQTVSRTANSRIQDTKEAQSNRMSKTATFEPNEGDSDKENWLPGTQQRSPPRRRPVGISHSQRRVLEESLGHTPGLGVVVSQERNFYRKLSAWKSTSNSASSSISEKENGGSEAHDRLSPVSGGISPRESDELDCVQNLLSLSQAAWR